MPTILIVEDHKDFRQAVCNFLQVSHVDADILEASSGEEAVATVQENKPQIILMDFWLKGMNGVEAATQIKAILPECSIIMLTMFDIKDVEPLAGQGVIKEFINKSDLCDNLVPSINKILNKAGGE
ncbi:MAG: response regulator transcription factor [Candidatus Omnitrophica bacterium]|nr:response regulator transcription factor [Candidatus Omnitrophota bacterium]